MIANQADIIALADHPSSGRLGIERQLVSISEHTPRGDATGTR